MAVSAASSAFRAGRKQSISNGSAPPFMPSVATMPMSPAPLAPGAMANGILGGGPTRPGEPSNGGAQMFGPGGAQLMTGAPQAANTIANKPAVAAGSLYQACLSLRDRLWCVPGFGDAFLDESAPSSSSSAVAPSPISGSAPPSPKGTAPKTRNGSSDPVTQLWQCFRLGAPLCWLLNCLGPKTELAINPDANRSNANECKRQVAKFIIALQNELGWDPDEIFTVSQLYLNDTNGFVKVVRTVSKLLDVFESRGLLTEPLEGSGDAAELLQKPSDGRAWIVRELLDTERKYVQDLEVMQNYARALGQMHILPPDTIHHLFGNLNALVDVQRRFLICVEDNVRRPADDQHFGHVFQTMEADFSAYEPFCANYAQALDIINAEAANIQRLRGTPAAEGCYLDPSYELPTFLIKPVQRICKYPLLLESLLKKTPPESPIYQELEDGLVVIRRITDKVNETRRLQENIQLVKDLETRVEDWKGHNINSFGPLLLSDVFMVAKSETEREYHVYLFEKILLCCKEVLPNQPKKNSKSNSLLKQKTSSTQTPPGKKPKTTLQLKGRIFINNVTGAFANSKIANVLGAPSNGQHALQVWWRGDLDQESFSLRCKNEEQLKQWQLAIQRLIDEVSHRRQNSFGYLGSGGSGGASPSLHGMAGTGANGRRNTGGSSHFPQTPLTELGSAYPFSRTDSQASHRPYDMEDAESARGGGGGGGDGSEAGMSSHQGRGTPMGGRYSTPAEHRERQLSLSSTEGRPRALTEDQNSATLTQWRSRSPNVPPPLPRNLSSSSASSEPHQLRKASSSRQLRQPGYAPHVGGYPRPPRQSGEPGTPSDPGDLVEQMESVAVRARGDSVASGMARTQSDGGHMRSRSSSNPSAYMQYPSAGPPPPIPKAPYPPHLMTNGSSSNSNSHESSSHVNGNGDKRFSSSSISTVDSARSLGSRRESTAASSPNTMSGSSGSGGPFKGPSTLMSASNSRTTAGSSTPTLPQLAGQAQQQHSNAVKLLVHHGDDRLVLVVLATIGHAELIDKILVKLRNVSGKRIEGSQLRVRYIDEDGDKIIMHDDDDVQMAFEQGRTLGRDVELIVSS